MSQRHSNLRKPIYIKASHYVTFFFRERHTTSHNVTLSVYLCSVTECWGDRIFSLS